MRVFLFGEECEEGMEKKGEEIKGGGGQRAEKKRDGESLPWILGCVRKDW